MSTTTGGAIQRRLLLPEPSIPYTPELYESTPLPCERPITPDGGREGRAYKSRESRHGQPSHVAFERSAGVGVGARRTCMDLRTLST